MYCFNNKKFCVYLLFILPDSSGVGSNEAQVTHKTPTCEQKTISHWVNCAPAVLAAEQRQVLAADERKREFHEDKRSEFENYAEEEHDGM